MYITVVLLLPAEKHAHADCMSEVPKANYDELKSVSLLFLPCYNSRTP